ncbi:hypothetical protein BMETH_1256_0 [methanotrophic bacterial endosymbiont of Bathymodiolus sp.]|nr:hypothetical protein BMETH_1256_0 [methanotrophic bacterial endosymbiont of Bathymodiolus sp.]
MLNLLMCFTTMIFSKFFVYHPITKPNPTFCVSNIMDT